MLFVGGRCHDVNNLAPCVLCLARLGYQNDARSIYMFRKALREISHNSMSVEVDFLILVLWLGWNGIVMAGMTTVCNRRC